MLSLPISFLLLASSGPSLYALETFKTFAGIDFIDVPSSPDLQLEEFTVEVGFRIFQEPAERGYLVSKSSVSNGSPLLDQNYALFVTPTNKVGGGFKALDGTYNYVYSPAISMGSWHIAKLIYDAGTLRLSVDGTPVSAKSVGKIADTLAVGDLRIGANANGQADKFFVGDMDYVKVVDRSTFVGVYFNDFKEATDPGPSPT
ncbi:MAG: LamG-like jellyroll fold domain-containing protein, partial [Nitrososphaera sp.]